MGGARGYVAATMIAFGAFGAACGSSPPDPDAGARPDAPLRDGALDGGSEDARPDGATDGGDASSVAPPRDVVAATPPRAPEAAAPPDTAGCPWPTRTDDEGVETCWAYPGEAAPPPCGAGAFRRPGEPGCVSVGAACPADGWPADPGPAALFVRAGATGGDGTRARPLGSIAAALDRVAGGGAVALATGTYREAVQVPAGVTIRGACASETIVMSGSAITLDGGALVDLTLEAPVVRTRAGASELRDVIVRGGSPSLEVPSGSLTLEGTLVESPDASGASRTLADVSATLQVSASVLRGARGVGLRARRGSTVTLSDSALRDYARVGGLFEGHLEVAAGASARLERSSFEGDLFVLGALEFEHVDGRARPVVVATPGAVVRGAGGSLAGGGVISSGDVELDDWVHRDEMPAGTPYASGDGHLLLRRADVATAGGEEVFELSGGTLVLEDVVARTPDHALDVVQGQATVTRARFEVGARLANVRGASRLELTDVQSTGGRGVEATEGTHLTIDGVELRDATAPVVYALGTVDLQDLSVDDATLGGTDFVRIPGYAIVLEGVSAGTVDRVRVRGAPAGLAIVQSSLTRVHDLVVAATTGREDLPGRSDGYGVVLRRNTLEDAARWTLRETRGAALRLVDAALIATDVDIDGVASVDARQGGRGVDVAAGSEFRVEGLRVAGYGDGAILVHGTGAVADLEDVTIEDARGGVDGTGGQALTISGAARMSVARARITGAREIALAAFEPFSDLSARDVRVTATAPRACAEAGCPGAGIAVGSYDGGRLLLERFVLEDSALAGVQVALDGQVELRRGEVLRNPIGVNVQVPGYDLDLLQNDVRYQDNGTNFDGELLPVPSTTPPVEDGS